MKKFRKLFPPLVAGSAVMAIGLALVGIAVNYCAGGFDAPDFGSIRHFAFAFLTLALIVILNRFGNGFIKAASVIIAMAIAYIIAFFFGMVDLSPIAEAPWFAIPMPLKYGVSFNFGAIGIMFIIYMVSMMEYIGDTMGAAILAAGREPTEKEYVGGILCDGLGSAFSALFNAFPNVSYSNCIGLIGLTGVASRYIVAMAGLMLVILGFVPKVSMVLSLTPPAILGGSMIVLFGLVATAGMKIITLQPLSQRNLMILGIGLAIGVGFNYTPGALSSYPFYVSALITGIPGTAITTLVLNLVLPKTKEDTDIDYEESDAV
jgi:NCS2 family nucleobase:cation symporter-2